MFPNLKKPGARDEKLAKCDKMFPNWKKLGARDEKLTSSSFLQLYLTMWLQVDLASWWTFYLFLLFTKLQCGLSRWDQQKLESLILVVVEVVFLSWKEETLWRTGWSTNLFFFNTIYFFSALRWKQFWREKDQRIFSATCSVERSSWSPNSTYLYHLYWDIAGQPNIT